MKRLWNVLALVLLINVLAAGGFVLWLRHSGRLSKERLRQAVAIFKPTILAEEQAAKDKAEEDDKLKAEAEKQAWLHQVEKGPVSTNERLSTDQMANDLALQKLERLQVEIRDLRASIAQQNSALADGRAQLEAERNVFEEAKKKELAKRSSDDFLRVVATLEQLKPRQTKEMLQDLSRQNKTAAVVEYLAAMDLRKASAVLSEYKSPEDIIEATDLIQQLRKRGMNIEDKAADPAARKADASP